MGSGEDVGLGLGGCALGKRRDVAAHAVAEDQGRADVGAIAWVATTEYRCGGRTDGEQTGDGIALESMTAECPSTSMPAKDPRSPTWILAA